MHIKKRTGDNLSRRPIAKAAWLASMLLCTAAVGGEAANESARSIPVAYQVDVVIVGGSTGAVAAAVEAAAAGAKVFLAAERPYLGDDMTATLRSVAAAGRRASPRRWPGSSSKIRCKTLSCRTRAACRSATRPTSRANRTPIPSRPPGSPTASGATRPSRAFNTIKTSTSLPISPPRDLAGVRVMAYEREDSDLKTGFKVGRIAVFTSDDQKSWQPAAVVESAKAEAVDQGVIFFTSLAAKARYVKLTVEKAPGEGRILLGEIEILGPAAAAVAQHPPAAAAHARQEDPRRSPPHGRSAVSLQLLSHRRAPRRPGQPVRHRHGQSGRTPGSHRQDDHRRDPAGVRCSHGRRKLPSLSGGHAHVEDA